MRFTIPVPSGPLESRRVSIDQPFEEWLVSDVYGDEIPVRIARPKEANGVVVVGHGLHGSRSSPYIAGASRQWVAKGLAVVSFDFPLSGDRAEEGQSLDAIRDPALVRHSIGDIGQVVEFARTSFPEVPVMYLGFSNGAILGTIFAGQSKAIDGLCLVVAGSRARQVRFTNPQLPAEAFELIEAADPAAYAPEVSCPVLMLSADRDAQFDRISAFDLYDAFDPPKELTFFPGTHTDWPHPGPVYRRITAFLTSMATQT
ncbi:MAG: hypothetical protein HKN46_08090 [Acidimicrobiia bacterium]|nr:hypothetical protein [Acidimicrobiia bacterium]